MWKVRGLGEAPLPLFAAADRADQAVSAEGIEPDVALRPLTDGREVIEDYRALQLSLRAHPLTFVRDELSRRGVTKCADLATIHVICDRIIDHGDLLHRVGEMSFPHRTGRGDGAKHAGSPDRGDKGWNPNPRNSYWPPHADSMDPEAVVKFKSHDFH